LRIRVSRRKVRCLREIEYLMRLALRPETPIELADRYVYLARMISMPNDLDENEDKDPQGA